MAVEFANLVLDWQENLPSDEMPPRWMWPFDEELESWFEEVEEKRKAKYGNSDSSSAEESDVPMMENELTRGRR